MKNNSQLKDKIDQLWDKFWSGGIFNPLTAIEQITYLLFMKRLNDLYLKNKADAVFIGDFYISFLGVILGVTFFQNLLKSAKI